jgi:CHASE2 domain-containing sensor protein
MDKAGLSNMGGIRQWIARQIARTPGEWIRAHIADKIIEAIFGHGIYSKAVLIMIGVISTLGGIWTWFHALVQHDPSIAVLIGLSVAVLLFIVIGVLILAILWARGLFSATAPPSRSPTFRGISKGQIAE